MPLTLIPSYPDLPMEKVYPRVPRTDIAQVFLRESRAPGASSTSPGTSTARSGRCSRSITWRCCATPSRGRPTRSRRSTVTGPGVLDVTVWRQKDSLTVHLVNLTNPMMMKGPVRELIPVGEQVVGLRVPEGRRPREVHLLAAGRTSKPAWNGSRLTVTVPSVLDHEVVAVDLS